MKITDIIKEKNRIKGYEIEDNGEKRIVPKQSVVYLIKTGRIKNATLQTLKDGREIIRVNKKTLQSNKIESNGTIANDIAITVKLSAGEKVELSGIGAINVLLKLQAGTPLKVKIADFLDWKQCIMLKVEKDANKGIIFTFFDGSGTTGLFQLSQKSILDTNSKIKFLFNDNDPVETNFLIKYMRKGPFNL